MTLIHTRELPDNFDLFLSRITQEYRYYFGKYIEEYLPLLKPTYYTYLLKNPLIECLLYSPTINNPTGLIISSCNQENTRRQVILFQYIENTCYEKVELFIKKVFHYWQSQNIQEIIFDIPTSTSFHLSSILCPFPFYRIPRVIMVKEITQRKFIIDYDENIHPLSENDIPLLWECLFYAYTPHSWAKLHPETYDEKEGIKFLHELIHFSTQFPTGLQYRLNNQCVGVLLGNITGVKTATIFQLAVHPSFRRRGIATTLFQTWLSLLYQFGIKNIFLWTHLTNPVLKLYLKEQFHPLYVYPSFYYTPERNHHERTID